MSGPLLAALCDATAVDERIYFNDDKEEHGRAVLANLEAAGYTVVPLEAARAAAPPVERTIESQMAQAMLEDMQRQVNAPDPVAGLREAGVIEGIDACIAIVEQSLSTVRAEYEDNPESRVIPTHIAAREGILTLLRGYRAALHHEAGA